MKVPHRTKDTESKSRFLSTGTKCRARKGAATTLRLVMGMPKKYLLGQIIGNRPYYDKFKMLSVEYVRQNSLSLKIQTWKRQP